MTYDEIGNATSIGDKQYTWTNGRQLAQYEDEDFRVEYTYNADGLRTSKSLYSKDEDPQTGEVTEHIYEHYDYVWKDSVIDSAKIIVYDEQTGAVSRTLTVKYLYDSEKSPVGFIFTDSNDGGNEFKAWYVKNLQGDVTEIYMEGKGVAVRYEYDAFGHVEILAGDLTGWDAINCLFTMVLCNTTMYRGYYFDIESQMYYLQSRYYDPQIGRFLNQDAYVDTDREGFGTNMFAYCENNPIKYIDPTGYTLIIGSTNYQTQMKIYDAIDKITNDRIGYTKLSNGYIKLYMFGRPLSDNTPKSDNLITHLMSNTYTCTIYLTSEGNGEVDINSKNAINGIGSSTQVYYNPNANPNILTKHSNGRCYNEKRPNYIGLAHELVHAYRSMKGKAIDYSINENWTFLNSKGQRETRKAPREELGTVGLKYEYDSISENRIRSEHGLSLRGAY